MIKGTHTALYSALGIALLYSTSVWAAPAFNIEQATIKLLDDVYQLSAQIDYRLSRQVTDALHSGVPITLTIDMQIYRERDWLWDEQITAIEQVNQIRYQALTKQYMVKNLNTGQVNNFSKIVDVLTKLGTVNRFPLIDRKLVSTNATFYTLLRARIDLEYLPVPLRLRAYTSSKWHLRSAWFRCQM